MHNVPITINAHVHCVPITINASLHYVPITINANVHNVPITYHSPPLCLNAVATIFRATQKNTENADILFTNSAVVCRICLWHCKSENLYSAHTQISMASDIIPILYFRVHILPKRPNAPVQNFLYQGLYPPLFPTYEHSDFKMSLSVNCTLTD